MIVHKFQVPKPALKFAVGDQSTCVRNINMPRAVLLLALLGSASAFAPTRVWGGRVTKLDYSVTLKDPSGDHVRSS